MTHVVYLAFVLAFGADTPKLMGTEHRRHHPHGCDASAG